MHIIVFILHCSKSGSSAWSSVWAPSRMEGEEGRDSSSEDGGPSPVRTGRPETVQNQKCIS